MKFESAAIDRRALWICALAVVLAIFSCGIALLLVSAIAFFTQLFFFGKISLHPVSPSENHLGWLVVFLPVIGGIVVGFLARYGSKAIRGHGIPEAMEQILENESRIPARVTILKPLSAAISIGSGGPFGAEGPIIATGGALGSLIGQILHVSSQERKTLLACGAAAGMTAIFGSPIAGVFLAIELLLFEFRPRSYIPVCVSVSVAEMLRIAHVGWEPVFSMPHLADPSARGILIVTVIGTLLGVAATLITRFVYLVEDGFEHLPVHWMWWPALGGIAVGVVGYFYPLTLGVGYDNIINLISGHLAAQAALALCLAKLFSWGLSLGSGTSGGTLAPLLTIGAGFGFAMGSWLGVDPRMAAVVGMASVFAGSSRALLASIIFAFEVTHETAALVPLLAGCTGAYIASSVLMKNTIMTEKIERRGVRVPHEYRADIFETLKAGNFATKDVVFFRDQDLVGEIKKKLTSVSHQVFPVLNSKNEILGMIGRREVLKCETHELTVLELGYSKPVMVSERSSIREVLDRMIHHDIGRLPVVSATNEKKLVGIISRSDLISAHDERETFSTPAKAKAVTKKIT